jgi:hypothetical protein
MKLKNARELRGLLFDGDGKRKPEGFALFESAVQSGKLKLSDFSVQDLARSFMGEQWSKPFQQMSLLEQLELREAGTPVTSTVFPQITSQLIFSEIRSQFMLEANVFTPLVPVKQSRIKGSEVVPSVTNLDPSDVQTVIEGQEYPSVGVTEEYFTLPAKDKKGLKIALTREAITFDRTGMLVEQARAIGKTLGMARENETIDALIGQTNNYSRNGTASNTYLTTGAYINKQTGTPLNDWTDIDNARQLFVDILDPNTSEPITHSLRHLVVMPFKEFVAKRILNATEVREIADAGVRQEQTIAANPVAGMGLQLLTSERLYRRVLAGPEATAAIARDGWFLGDISQLLTFYEVWPLEVVQRTDSQASFDSDIEMQFKASYYGVTAVREPRYMLRLENTAW